MVDGLDVDSMSLAREARARRVKGAVCTKPPGKAKASYHGTQCRCAQRLACPAEFIATYDCSAVATVPLWQRHKVEN